MRAQFAISAVIHAGDLLLTEDRVAEKSVDRAGHRDRIAGLRSGVTEPSIINPADDRVPREPLEWPGYGASQPTMFLLCSGGRLAWMAWGQAWVQGEIAPSICLRRI